MVVHGVLLRAMRGMLEGRHCGEMPRRIETALLPLLMDDWLLTGGLTSGGPPADRMLLKRVVRAIAAERPSHEVQVTVLGLSSALLGRTTV